MASEQATKQAIVAAAAAVAVPVADTVHGFRDALHADAMTSTEAEAGVSNNAQHGGTEGLPVSSDPLSANPDALPVPSDALPPSGAPESMSGIADAVSNAAEALAAPPNEGMPNTAEGVPDTDGVGVGEESMQAAQVQMPQEAPSDMAHAQDNIGDTVGGGMAVGGVALATVPDQAPMKDDHLNVLRGTEEIPLVEVAEAMIAANDVFNRVKSEKIAEQALCSIRNDQAQYEGLAKEIVGKAIKQKERERANRASAAASRAKVLRYQTELESRLNRMEAERNAYRREVHELRNIGENARKMQPDEVRQLSKLQDWIRKMESANPQFVRSVIAQGEMDKLLGEDGILDEKMEFEAVKEEEEHDSKRRRL